jgi:hypothetical protein
LPFTGTTVRDPISTTSFRSAPGVSRNSEPMRAAALACTQSTA